MLTRVGLLVFLSGCRLGFDLVAVGDAGDGDSGNDLDGADASSVAPNLMFLSSTTVDLCAVGVAGADDECTARATAAGLPGRYVSWTSDPTSDARSRLGNAAGWNRVDGRPFATNLDQLLTSQPFFPPRVDEMGVEMGFRFTVSGTNSSGEEETATTSQSCEIGGLSYWGAQGWFTGFVSPGNHVLCFGVDQVATVTHAPVAGRLAFVSTGLFSASTGIAAADAICSDEAAAASRAGTYRAFMTTSTVAAASRFNLGGAPWVRVDGVPLMTSAADLSTFTLLAPLDVRLDGSIVRTGSWTGHGDVTNAAWVCNDWSSASAAVMGVGKDTADASPQFNVMPGGCSTTRPVLCFQN